MAKKKPKPNVNYIVSEDLIDEVRISAVQYGVTIKALVRAPNTDPDVDTNQHLLTLTARVSLVDAETTYDVALDGGLWLSIETPRFATLDEEEAIHLTAFKKAWQYYYAFETKRQKTVITNERTRDARAIAAELFKVP